MVSPTNSRQTGVSPQIVPYESTGWRMVALMQIMSMCTLCQSSFQCRAQNVRVHEQGKKSTRPSLQHGSRNNCRVLPGGS
eukprot:123556-Pelagomonas_calceolata.AAC.1